MKQETKPPLFAKNVGKTIGGNVLVEIAGQRITLSEEVAKQVFESINGRQKLENDLHHLAEALESIKEMRNRPDYHSDKKLIEFAEQVAKEALNRIS